MAQLGYFKIDTKGEYVKLADITGLTLTSGTTYSFQVEGACRFAPLDTKPEKGGVYVNKIDPFTYTASDLALWVKTNTPCYLNIMD